MDCNSTVAVETVVAIVELVVGIFVMKIIGSTNVIVRMV